MNNSKNLIKISDVVENQIPEFILTENPNFSEFLKQYYISQQFQSGPVDLSENIAYYKNADAFDSSNLISETTLNSDIEFFDETVLVSSTKGWPDKYGLLKIDDEIITYTGITTNSFTGCIRGFSGIESLENEDNPEFLVFSTTESDSHKSGSKVQNLSNLFLQKFFEKIKYQFIPGFESVDFHPSVNPQNFISKARSFYQTKGTNQCYEILFKLLYNETVEIVKPKDRCFTTSDDKWIVTETFVCEVVEGNPYNIKGETLYQTIDVNNQVLPASGSIYEVESFLLENKLLFKIKIFAGYSNNLNPNGSILGKFLPTARTNIVEDIVGAKDVIFVDSTIGFPKSGTIEINGVDYTYTDKTNNEFLNVTGFNASTSITKSTQLLAKNYVFAYENGDSEKVVKLRLFNILSKIKSEDVLYALDQDPIKVSSIGIREKTAFNSSFVYNLPLTINSGIATTFITPTIRNYFKKGFSISNGLAVTKTNHNLRANDTINLFTKIDNRLIKGNLNVDTSLSKEFTVEAISDTSILGKELIFRRNIKKSKAIPFSRFFGDINDKYSANILDCYSDNNYYYLTSNGLPDYQINPYERRSFFNVTDNYKLAGEHNFYNGEEVVVSNYTVLGEYENPLGIQTGNSYYVKRTNSGEIQISESRENVGLSSFISFIEKNQFGFETGRLDTIEFVASSVYGNILTSSRLLKKFPKKPVFSEKKQETQPGSIGIFVNGVEIQNYKSFDKIYYGPIENVVVLNGGSDYSLINPPKLKIYGISNKLEIIDNKTVLIPSMKGKLKDLIIKNPGFDYQETPIVTITGGNNSEVITEVKMKDVNKEIIFNATTKDSVVNTINNELRFGFPHGFITGEPIVYETFGTKPIGIGTIVADGTLLNNEVYYAVNIGAGTSIKLASSKEEALAQTNLLKFRTTGGGIQGFKSTEPVQVIDRVSILSKNLDFEYKKRSFGYDDINPYNNTFLCSNHGFRTGESVLVSSQGAPLDGPVLGTTYYIVKVDDDTFKLSTSKETINYVEIISVDPATTYFVEYEPVKVNVTGKIKKNESSLPGYGATILPVVEGSVEDVRVQRGLASPPEEFFGISSVLNYNNAPIATLYEGNDASLYPLVVSGKINQVIVKSSGYDYYNNIELKVKGSGYGAKLLPVVLDGKIIDVNIISPGVGYASTNTTIEVVTLGKNLKLKAELKSWTVNEVTKLGINNISSGNLFGKRYSIFGNTYGTFFLDLNQRTALNIPLTPDKHSPIVGWAYDGCPIYGPFAYTNQDGSGDVIRMRSGYSRNKISPFSLDCIEDYVFTGTGTLDEYNGRYCVTPEYPNGIYAYFCTLNESNSPEYPYVIGGKYNYTPQKENFDLRYNQNLDINTLGIIKNTAFYRLDDLDDSYEYFKLYPSDIPDAKVTSSTVGKVTKIDVINGGEGYEVGDKISFNSDFTEGFGAYGEVSEVGGVGVSSIFKTTTTIENITLTSTKGGILGITTTEHDLVNDDFITISGISTTDFEFLESYYKIKVQDQLVTGLSTSLNSAAVTGELTYIKVKESLFKFEIDDKLEIENETMTVIGLDYSNNTIRVLRQVGSPGYGIGSTVYLQNNEFTIPYPQKNLVLPEKKISYYFDPSTQIPIGVTTSVGTGSTVYDYFVGYGKSTTKFVSNGSLYLPNHKFKTGDKLKYSYPNTSSSIVTNSGNLESVPEIYAVKLSDDAIGIVENKLFLKNKDNLLLYTSPGTGNLHKLETDNTLVTCELNRNIVTVTTGDEVGIGSTFVQISHNLNVGDKVNLTVRSNEETTYVVGYSTITKRLTINGQVNPELNFIENETIVFDITSPDLAGCEFNFYTDRNFENVYYGNDITGLEVTRSINDVSLTITDSTPRILYYNLTSREKEIYPDIEVENYNQILIISSKYNISTDVISKTDYTFNVSLQDIPEKDSYTSEVSEISYSVTSKGIKGPISKAKVLFGGVNYKKLPKIDEVISTSGIGANLIASSNNIGKIKATKILNNTSIFPTDKTLTPVSYLYSVATVYNNFSITSIEIDYPGSNYISPPDLILYNRKENLIVDNFDSIAKLKNSFIESIEILNPGTGLKSSDNEIICVNNTNGFKVLNAVVSGSNPYTVDVTLETPLAGFSTSNDLPLEIGDKIFVENIFSSFGNGFNSSNHKYQTFEITFVDKAYGSQDAALVRYEIPSYPGVFDVEETYNASIIDEKNIPILRPILQENEFTNSEKINGSQILDNESNSPITSLIKVYDSSGLSEGQVITGDSSNSKGKIYTITDYPKSATTTIDVDSSVKESIGWKNFRGNLSSILQKLPDNDYYQSFSYSLKSKKSYSEWNSIVSDLSHVSGYKKFSDMVIESVNSNPVGINSDASSVVNVIVTSESDVGTIVNYDLVSEEDLDDNEGTYSEYLKFSSKTLSNYLLSIENKVLPIDDISTLFDTDNSPVVNIVVDTINTNESTVLKYYFFIASTASFFGDFVVPQILELLVTRLDEDIFLTSYGWYWDNTGSDGKSKLPLGEISASFGPTNSDEIVISFTPRNIFNSYSVRAIKEVTNNLVGIASTSFGFIDSIEQTSSFTSVQAGVGSPQTVLSIPTTDCTSGVVFFGISDSSKQIKNALEFSFIKDGPNIQINQYTEFEPVDLGELEVQQNGLNIDFVFTGVGIAVTVFTNYTLFTESSASPIEVVRDLSRLGTVEIGHSGTSPVGISTISSVYGATKYVIEMSKTFDDGVGIVTQRSLLQINTVHFEQYSNNVEFGIIGSIPTDELIFSTEYDSFNQEYILTFDPIVDAVYDFKIYEKSIVSPNQVL